MHLCTRSSQRSSSRGTPTGPAKSGPVSDLTDPATRSKERAFLLELYELIRRGQRGLVAEEWHRVLRVLDTGLSFPDFSDQLYPLICLLGAYTNPTPEEWAMASAVIRRILTRNPLPIFTVDLETSLPWVPVITRFSTQRQLLGNLASIWGLGTDSGYVVLARADISAYIQGLVGSIRTNRRENRQCLTFAVIQVLPFVPVLPLHDLMALALVMSHLMRVLPCSLQSPCTLVEVLRLFSLRCGTVIWPDARPAETANLSVGLETARLVVGILGSAVHQVSLSQAFNYADWVGHIGNRDLYPLVELLLGLKDGALVDDFLGLMWRLTTTFAHHSHVHLILRRVLAHHRPDLELAQKLAILERVGAISDASVLSDFFPLESYLADASLQAGRSRQCLICQETDYPGNPKIIRVDCACAYAVCEPCARTWLASSGGKCLICHTMAGDMAPGAEDT